MSKVQTFEEWLQEANGLNMSYLIVSGQVDKLRNCWQAAMENAARVCDSLLESDEYIYEAEAGMDICREAIRKAAKR